jgi:hypothetical protein
MLEGLSFSGAWQLTIREAAGGVRFWLAGSNRVVVDGFEEWAQLAAGSGGVAISEMRAGTNPDATKESMSDLQGATKATTSTSVSVDGNEINYIGNFSALSSNESVAEFGLFNSNGVMFARFVVEEFTLFAGQSMDLSWVIRTGK